MTVAVVSTGGTIASEPGGSGARPKLTSDDLVRAVPGLDDEIAVKPHDFSRIPSTHFTVSQMYELVELIRELEEDEAITGVVVTQGTDILEEVAYFVDLCYTGAAPVVFTGAMRNPSLASSDGPGNLLSSIRTAASPEARNRGVLVVFNERVHHARDVTKAHSMNVDAFRSPEFGPIAVHDEDRITWRRTSQCNQATFSVDPEQLTNNVQGVYVTADMPGCQLPKGDECEAVCVACTGAGHIPPSIVQALQSLTDSGVPIIATTRCLEGRLALGTYDFEGSERTLQELGCYYADVNLQKSRIGAMVGLAADALDQLYERPGAV